MRVYPGAVVSYHDHETLEEFVRALARATEYSSYSCGPNISTYWKEEAEEWVKELDAAKAEVKAEAEAAQQAQTSGPQCKKCGAFTTYTRVNTHGMCMKCENA